MGRKGRFLAVLAGLALVASVAVTAACGAQAPTRASHRPRSRSAARSRSPGWRRSYKTIPAAEGAYFAYVNAHGGVNGRKIDFTRPRRRVRPVEDGAADAAARRAGQGLRRLRQPRHRAEPLDLEVPEPAKGAAGAHRHRRLVLGLLARRSTRGRSATSPTIRVRARSTASTSRRTCRTRRSACSTRTTRSARTTSPGLRVGLGAKKSQIVDARSRMTRRRRASRSRSSRSRRRALTRSSSSPLPSQAITALVTATKVGWTPTTFLGERVERTRSSSGSRRRTARTSTASSRRAISSTSSRRRRTCRASSSRSRSSARTHRRSSRAWTRATRTSCTGSAQRGRSSTRSSTQARTRRGPA